MPRLKNETISLRTTPETKELLRLAAASEHRSVASMVELLVRDYAEAHGLTLPSARPTRSSAPRRTKDKPE